MIDIYGTPVIQLMWLYNVLFACIPSPLQDWPCHCWPGGCLQVQYVNNSEIQLGQID